MDLPNWGVWEHYTHSVEELSNGELIQVTVTGSVTDNDAKKLRSSGWLHNNNNIFTLYVGRDVEVEDVKKIEPYVPPEPSEEDEMF